MWLQHKRGARLDAERLISQQGARKAGHSFLNDHDPSELPLWVKALTKLAAAEGHEPSARDARRRIIAFFDAHAKSRAHWKDCVRSNASVSGWETTSAPIIGHAPRGHVSGARMLPREASKGLVRKNLVAVE